MKKLVAFLIGISLFLITQSAFALIEVGDYGETGWQTFTHTFDALWMGKAGFLVSNYGDEDLNSVLLIDKLNKGPADNAGFELGNLDGYTEGSSAISVVTYFTSYGGIVYYPTEGDYMAALSANGADTTAYGGTNGAILWTTDTQTFQTGEVFSFNWNFLAFDYAPYCDFAMLLHTETGSDRIERDELARIGGTPIPEPATLSLLGLGLLGLLGLRKRRLTG